MRANQARWQVSVSGASSSISCFSLLYSAFTTLVYADLDRILNACIANTSSAEIGNSIKATVIELASQSKVYTDAGSEHANFASESIIEMIDRNMYTSRSPPLDLLIRTGDTHRLSDFLLWQCHEKTSIVFIKQGWPDLNIRRLLAIIVEWQRAQKRNMTKVCICNAAEATDLSANARQGEVKRLRIGDLSTCSTVAVIYVSTDWLPRCAPY